MYSLWRVSLLLLCNMVATNTIQRVTVNIPEFVSSGSSVILTCSYRVTEGEAIDSVKWYLNSSEIYRLVPGLHEDRVLTFPPGGDCVSLPQSGLLRPGLHRLVLENVARGSSGDYICQVTESSPPFHTEQAAARLQIFVRPREGPQLAGLLEDYRPGAVLNVSCTSGPSLPPCSLTWTVNGKQVAASSWSVGSESASGLLPSSSQLQLRLSQARVAQLGAHITVRCTAAIQQVFSAHQSGRASLLRVSQPVLGEPLLSNNKSPVHPQAGVIGLMIHAVYSVM